jgi:hypothetical protein
MTETGSVSGQYSDLNKENNNEGDDSIQNSSDY